MRKNIDAVVTENPFYCSSCRESHDGGPVVRLLNQRPDHPQEVESVDLLICGKAWEFGSFELWAAEQDKIGPTVNPTEDLKAILLHPYWTA